MTPGSTCKLGAQAVVVACGMGPDRARLAAGALADDGVEGLVSWGTAGALVAGIEPGVIIVPGSVSGPDGSRYPCDGSWVERLAKHPGVLGPGRSVRLVTVAEVADSVESKGALGRDSGAVAVDMESAAVAAVARARAIPFVAVRAVSDDAGMVVPVAALAAMDESGRVRAGLLIMRLLRHPAELPPLLRLARGSSLACQALRWLVLAAGPRLRYD